MPSTRTARFMPTMACLLVACGSNGNIDAAADAGPDGADAAPYDVAGDVPYDAGATQLITVSAGTLAMHEDGTLDLHDPTGLVVLDRARADVLVADSGRGTVVQTTRCTVEHPSATAIPTQADVDLGGARDTLALHCAPRPDVSLDWYAQGHAGTTGLTFRLHVLAHNAVKLTRASPLVVAPSEGAFYVSGGTADDRILDNGSLVIGDFTVRLYPGTQARDVFANVLPIPVRGNVVSNGDLALQDLATGRGVAAGFLTDEHGFALVGLGSSGDRVRPREDGAGAYDTLAAETLYYPNGKPIAAGGDWWSEVFYLDVNAPDGITARERFGDALAHANGITPWHARTTTGVGSEGRHVPSAWQSWCLGFQGGYAHAIASTVIQQNVDAAARDLAPYGFGIVPIDDGWQLAWGDWTPDPTRFPDGWSGETGYANARGLGGGYWIAPFGLDRTSMLGTTHPEWIAAIEPVLGPIFVGSASAVLDLSRDDVIARVRQVSHEMNAVGLAWYKQDFAYRALAESPADPNYTSIEAYRRGWGAVRAETPDATLLLSVAIFAPNYGVADAIRTGLDNGGRWDELVTDPDSVTANTRALKATVRTATRRWYLNDRVVLLDPDGIPFRGMDTPSTIGDTEERTFALYTGLLGGVIEVGDPLVGMRPFAQDMLRRLFPVYGRAARPLDVFVRDYNERWVLPVTSWSSDAQAPAPWAVVAATNWGRNRDWSRTPPAYIPDGAQHYTFTRDEVGLGAGPLWVWDLWNHTFETWTADTLGLDVSAHDSALRIVRRAQPGVALLGTDRHVTGGAIDVIGEHWDPTLRTYTLRFHAVAAGPGGRTMPVTIALHADTMVTSMPAATLVGVASSGGVPVVRTGELVSVVVTPTTSSDATLTLVFP